MFDIHVLRLTSIEILITKQDAAHMYYNHTTDLGHTSVLKTS